MELLWQLLALAIWALPVVLAVTLHEVAHGWMARAFGDPTAAEAGRLSLNPLAHVDPVGTLMVPGLLLLASGVLNYVSGVSAPPVLFGWAKPVPVDWRRLRPFRLGLASVALAGPGANLLMMLGWALVGQLALLAPQSSGGLLIYMAQAGIIGNAVLMLLNLLPIPPLDGSRVVTVLLPRSLARPYARMERFGLFIVLALLATGLLGAVLGPPLNWLTRSLGVG